MSVKQTSTLDFHRILAGRHTETVTHGVITDFEVDHGLDFLPVAEAWFQIDDNPELHRVTNLSSTDIDTIYFPLTGYVFVDLFILANKLIIEFSNDDSVNHDVTVYYLVYADKALQIQ